MCSFRVEVNMCNNFVLSFVYISFGVVNQIIKRGSAICDPNNWFNPATCLYLSQARALIFNVISRCPIYIQCVQVRCDCSFCWYWWNSCYLFFSFICMFCISLFVLLAIVLSVLLRYTDSDYPLLYLQTVLEHHCIIFVFHTNKGQSTLQQKYNYINCHPRDKAIHYFIFLSCSRGKIRLNPSYYYASLYLL